MKIYLLELTGHDPATEASATNYFGTHGYTSGSTYYQPRIKKPGIFSQSIYSPGTTGGQSSGGYGMIELVNTDGGIDELVNWTFTGYSCVIKSGQSGAALSTFSIVMTGTVEQVEFNWGTVKIRFKDNTLALKTPVRLSTYVGDVTAADDLDYRADLAGTEKPRLFGTRYNFSPVLVNGTKFIYQISDGLVSSIIEVRQGGIVLTAGSSRTLAALKTTTPTEQYDWAFDATGSYIRLKQTPTYDITMGATVTGTLGATLKTLALEKVTAVVEQSIIALDAALDAATWGFYTGQKGLTTQAVLDALCSAGIWWGFDNTGKFWAQQLTAPSGTAQLQLTKTEILSIDRIATNDPDRGAPLWRVVVRYKQNDTQQSDLAGRAASLDSAAYYGGEWLEAVYEDAAYKVINPLATELVIDSCLQDETAALAEAVRQYTLRSGRVDRLKVRIPEAAVQYVAGGWWDDAAVSELTTKVSNTATVIHGGYLYVIGGQSGVTPTAKVVRLNLADPTGAWDDAGVTDLPTTRYSHAAVVYGDYVYVIAGTCGDGFNWRVIRLDLTAPTGAWDDAGVTDLPISSWYDIMAVVHGNYLYCFGGNFSGSVSAISRRLNLTSPTGAWDETVTDLPSARSNCAYAVYGDYVYLAGGYNGSSIISTVIRLNLTAPTGAWDDAGVTDLPAVRSSGRGLMVGSQFWVMCGGNGSSYLGSIVLLDLTNPAGSWDSTSIVSLPQYRTSLQAEYYSGHVFVVGGYSAGTTNGISTYMLRTNSNPADRAELTGLGRTAEITIPRYDYDSGQTMKIIGTETDFSTNKITLDLWGPVNV